MGSGGAEAGGIARHRRETVHRCEAVLAVCVFQSQILTRRTHRRETVLSDAIGRNNGSRRESLVGELRGPHGTVQEIHVYKRGVASRHSNLKHGQSHGYTLVTTSNIG